MCVLEHGPTPRHLLFCRVLWCHPPTSPLCFHTSLNHGTAAPFVGSCACMHAVPNGRYFKVEFCLYLHLFKESLVDSCTLQKDCKDHSAARLERQLQCWSSENLPSPLPCKKKNSLFISNAYFKQSLHGAFTMITWIPVGQTCPCCCRTTKLVKCRWEKTSLPSISAKLLQLHRKKKIWNMLKSVQRFIIRLKVWPKLKEN